MKACIYSESDSQKVYTLFLQSDITEHKMNEIYYEIKSLQSNGEFLCIGNSKGCYTYN